MYSSSYQNNGEFHISTLFYRARTDEVMISRMEGGAATGEVEEEMTTEVAETVGGEDSTFCDRRPGYPSFFVCVRLQRDIEMSIKMATRSFKPRFQIFLVTPMTVFWPHVGLCADLDHLET